MKAIELKNVKKSFKDGDETIEAFLDVFEIRGGGYFDTGAWSR